MQFLDLFKPKWKQSNEQVRLDAIKDMKATDAEVLTELA